MRFFFSRWSGRGGNRTTTGRSGLPIRGMPGWPGRPLLSFLAIFAAFVAATALSLTDRDALNVLIGRPTAGVTPTEAANILAGTSGMTLTDALNSCVTNGLNIGIPQSGGNVSVRANGIWGAMNTTANASVAVGDSSRHWFVHHHTTRIWWNCEVDSIRLYLAQGTESNYTRAHIEFWERRAGQRHYLRRQTGNMLTGTGAGVRTWIPPKGWTLSRGDYPVVYLRKTIGLSGGSMLAAPAASNSLLRSVINANPADASFTWYAQTSLGAFVIEVEVWAHPCDIAVSGYSQAEAHNLIHGYRHDIAAVAAPGTACDTTSATDPALVTDDWMSVFCNALRPGTSYYNAAVGGATSDEIRTRFPADVAQRRPRVAIIQIGGNDTSRPVAVPYTNLETVLDTCEVRGIWPWVLAMTPMTAKTNAEMAHVDSVNTLLRNLCETHASGPLFISFNGSMGQFRATGPTGNLWDIVTAYNADGLHFTAAGQQAYAETIRDALTVDVTRP